MSQSLSPESGDQPALKAPSGPRGVRRSGAPDGAEWGEIAPSSVPSWRGTLAVFLAFVALYLLTASGHLSTPDEEVMFRVTESLATRGSLAIDPLRGPDGDGFASRPGVNGREYAQYGVGNSLAAVPLYWIGAAVGRIVEAEAAEEALDFRTSLSVPARPGSPERGPALLRRFVVSFQGILIAAALVALVWRMAYRIAAIPAVNSAADATVSGALLQADPEGNPAEIPAVRPALIAWLSAIAFGAGTMAWTHSRTFFSEPLAACFVLLSLAVAAGGGRLRPPSPLRAAAATLAFAGALLTRLDSAVLLPGLAALLTLRWMEESSPASHPSPAVPRLVSTAEEALVRLRQPGFWKMVAAAMVPLVLFGMYQLSLNRILFGSVGESAYADQKEGIHFNTPLLLGLYGFFFSVGKSVFLFSPALVLGTLGWAALWRRWPALAVGLATVILCKLLFQSRWQNWAGGWDWGPRHVYQIHAFAMLPLAAWLSERWSRASAASATAGASQLRLSPARKAVYVLVMIPAVLVQLYGTSQHPVDYYTMFYALPGTRPRLSAPAAVTLYSPAEAQARIGILQGLGRLEPEIAVEAYHRSSIAPLNDSIYVPQNSVWAGYSQMWDLGYTDNLWLRLLKRTQGRERAIQ